MGPLVLPNTAPPAGLFGAVWAWGKIIALGKWARPDSGALKKAIIFSMGDPRTVGFIIGNHS